MTKIMVVAAVASLLSACTDTADVFPMNEAAQQRGPVQVTFVRTGIGRGPITITMADGEVLKGEYRIAFGSGTVMAFSGTHSAFATSYTDGPVQFVARGPKTQMLCRGNAGTIGHGNGECQTHDGAVWSISW